MSSVVVPQLGLSTMPYRMNSKRERYMRQKEAMWLERASWDSNWLEISELMQPRAGRFFKTPRNDGRNRFNRVYDSTGLRARRILSAGLMSGLTSPARPWFRLKIPDRKLMERKAVAEWLHFVTEMMRDIFRSSNTYRALPTVYNELAAFGTAASFLEEDFDSVIRHYPATIGSFALAENAKRQVDTIVRSFDMPVGAMVKMFGREACSRTVKTLYDNGNYHTWIPVVHYVAPREQGERDLRSPLARDMAFTSCWFEEATDNPEKLLRESGYKRFPALTPRWSRTGEDIYGDSPGMEALGDVKQLMHEQLRKAQALDYQTNPPLVVPTGYKGQEVERLPGGVIYADIAGQGQNAVKSAFDVNLRLDHLLPDIEDVRMRIDRAFYVDLFLMMANIERSNVTAREIAEKHEEKLLMLGPVLETLDEELLEPLIDFTFDRMVETNIMPPPPPELQGQEINIEFIGVLAQAQRAVGIGAMDRLLTTVGGMAQLKPDVLDKLDMDQMVDEYADMLAVPPSVVLDDEVVADVRARREQAVQAQQMMEQMKPMADTAKTLSETDPTQQSVLNSGEPEAQFMGPGF